jgi:methylase of polypeptide subunit release factors
MAGTGWLTSPSDAAIARRRLTGDAEFGAAFRLFFLGLDVDAKAAERALAPVSLSALAGMGLLAREGASVRPLVQLAPLGSLLVAADRGDSLRAPRDFVTGRTPSTLALLGHTIRRPVEAALDLGSGNGAQALAAAGHADSVVATDVNPRALAFTRFNAAMNGVASVECREGSWFESVGTERFDLVVANPPFVISPDSEMLYRDAGLPGDTASRQLVAGAAEHLVDGGFAHLVCSWAHTADDWVAPLGDWLEGTGCDAWALRFWSSDPLGYAAGWNAHLRDADPAEFEATVERWLEHYRAMRIEAIAYGVMILRRRSSGPNWLRAGTTRGVPTGDPTAHLLRLFAPASTKDDEELLAMRLAPAAGQIVEQLLVSDGRGYRPERAVVRVAPGIGLRCEVNGAVVGVLERLDGARSLRDVLAENGTPPAAILPAVRRLLDTGMVTAS